MPELTQSEYVKVRVASPVSSANAIREAMAMAGAGVQGEYTRCSGSYRQVGRFMPEAGSTPTIGSIGVTEEVEEEVIETICHKDKVADAIKAILAVHPYEEPAIDILPRLEVE